MERESSVKQQVATLAGGAAVRRLRRLVDGAVHAPGDPGYDTRRRTLDPGFVARPAAIVEAEGAADVRTALVIAREHDLPFAVQSTGHGTRVPCDGGVLVKTGRLATVLVDPDRRVAHVGAGARWGDVLAAAAPFGLAPLSGSSPDVGVAGYTLGGGLGWLARRHGFAADSLLRAEVVTADAGPAGHRSTRFSVVADTPAPGLVRALAEHGTGGSFLNFLADPARVQTAYTAANWRRLREVKRAYDPDDVLRVGAHVPPAPAPRRRAADARLRW